MVAQQNPAYEPPTTNLFSLISDFAIGKYVADAPASRAQTAAAQT